MSERVSEWLRDEWQMCRIFSLSSYDFVIDCNYLSNIEWTAKLCSPFYFCRFQSPKNRSNLTWNRDRARHSGREKMRKRRTYVSMGITFVLLGCVYIVNFPFHLCLLDCFGIEIESSSFFFLFCS